VLSPQKVQCARKHQRKHPSRKPKATLLQGPGASKARTKSQGHTLAQPPSWESLPICTFDDPSHHHLPDAFTQLLKECKAASHSSMSHLCTVPTFFELQWNDTLQCLYCTTHRYLLAGNYIWSHISTQHKGMWPKITRSGVLVGFLGHLQRCHPSIVNQSPTDLQDTLPDQLTEQLPSTPVVQ
jgi:hypothetical protein